MNVQHTRHLQSDSTFSSHNTHLDEQLLSNVQLEHPDDEVRLLLVHFDVARRHGVRASHVEVHRAVVGEGRIQVDSANVRFEPLNQVQVLVGQRRNTIRAFP